MVKTSQILEDDGSSKHYALVRLDVLVDGELSLPEKLTANPKSEGVKRTLILNKMSKLNFKVASKKVTKFKLW